MSLVLTPWQPCRKSVSIDADVVQLWRFPLIDPMLETRLDSLEAQRAQRLRVPGKARAFAVARTRLRQILGLVLDQPPQAIAFRYNQYGKPFLVDSPVMFNLSHSGGWGVCAVTRSLSVGVDLEALDAGLDYQPLARRFFSAAETAWLQGTPENRRRRNFFRLWTRKEAWLKGQGGGFSESTVALDPVHIGGRAGCAGGWWLGNVVVAPGYLGALAVGGEFKRLVRWDVAAQTR